MIVRMMIVLVMIVVFFFVLVLVVVSHMGLHKKRCGGYRVFVSGNPQPWNRVLLISNASSKLW
jgi:hypothetical protein